MRLRYLQAIGNILVSKGYNMQDTKGYPNLQEAERLWEEGIEFRRNQGDYNNEEKYHSHTTSIAKAAKIIANHTDGMNPEKAYILGLLHDYGKKKKEKENNNHHGIAGFDEMIKLGYTDVARICLTHSFTSIPLNHKHYNYPEEWLKLADEKLFNIQIDDYDRLIQFCDMLFDGQGAATHKNRINAIQERYNLNELQVEELTRNAKELKSYFDEKCGCDVYSLIGLS